MKLRKALTFPGKYKARIKFKRNEFFRYHGGTALWDEDRTKGGTIMLDRTRTHEKLREDLRHELGHVFIDWLEYYMDRVKF